jgi:radical SAM protein with 4Fe4S-binding SPASM domain
MTGSFDMNGILTLPKMIEIDPVETCNLRCRMCHVSFMPPEKHAVFDITLLPKLKVLEGAFVSVASGFEPMMYPNFDRLMRGLTDLGMHMQIITNGTLLDRAKIETLLDSNMGIINFSFDGIRKQTFEHIRRGACYEETLDNILSTREAFQGRETAFLINSTTMRCNLDESIDILDFWDRHDFEVVRFLPMVVRYPDPGLICESLYPIRDKMKKVFDEAAVHVIENNLRVVMLLPYLWTSEIRRRFPKNCCGLYVQSDNADSRKFLSLREQFQLGEHPLMRFYDCRSAFTAATILANGDVQLCYKFSVGNLHESAFEDIWFGEEAHRVRQQIVSAPTDCAACDCFRFGIGFHTLDVERIENYFSGDLGPYLKYVDFETGVIHAQVAPKPPRLVSSEGQYNIVFYGNRYFGVPQSIGPLEVDKTDLSNIPSVLVENTYTRLVARIRRSLDESPELAEHH